MVNIQYGSGLKSVSGVFGLDKQKDCIHSLKKHVADVLQNALKHKNVLPKMAYAVSIYQPKNVNISISK